jgi:acyl carrier protein
MEIPDKLRNFINEQRDPLPPVTHPDEPLHFDSHDLIRLVAFLETDLEFRVPDEELIPANFENLRAIGRLLAGEGMKLI